jgi:hypothetical protein
VKSTVRNVLPVSPETFWERIFFDAAFVDALHVELGFETFEILEHETLADGRIRRVARAIPPVHAPAALKKRLDQTLSYVDDGVYDPRTREWTFRTIPGVFADSIYVGGRIYVLPHAQGVEHVCELEARVSVFGIGSMIEKILDKNTRESFSVTARFITRWADEHGLCCQPSQS